MLSLPTAVAVAVITSSARAEMADQAAAQEQVILLADQEFQGKAIVAVSAPLALAI
jgi:5S rRNA maturation endonuclease (ribonuclease M5)